MRIFLIILISLFTLQSFAQTESNAQRTVDTLIIENSGNGPCSSGTFATTWRVRFTIALDGSIRPTIAYTNGQGEVGTDTTNISKFGPYYWKNNGWNGSVKTVNGTHYPNLLCIEQPAVNQRPWHLDALLDTLFAHYPQLYLAGSFHVMGLSEGVSFWQDYLAYQPTAGVFPGMVRISSMVDLEGQGGETDFGCTANPTYPAFVGYWAKHYGGHFFGLEGINDSRNIWQITQNIGDSTGVQGYFSYTNFNCGDGSGTGGHGCWNSMYDPSQTNWTNVGSPGNANVVISTSPASTPGNYVYVASTGTNIFQWALRQGDTSLKGTTTFSLPDTSMFAGGEYVSGESYLRFLYSLSSNVSISGANGTGVPGSGIAATLGAGIGFLSNTLHGIAAVTTQGYVYTYGGVDQGQGGIGIISPTPTAVPTKVTVDSSGTDSINNVTIVQGTYCGNATQGLYIVKHGTLSDTLCFNGARGYGIAGDGLDIYDTVSRPVKVWSLPSGLRFKQIAAERYGVALLSDGSVWTTGGGITPHSAPSYAQLGYVGSGNQYLTWHQVTGFDTAIAQICGGDVPGVLCLSYKGKLWGFGPNGAYMGDSTDPSYTTPHDLTTNITNFIPGGIKQICANSQCFHAISNLDSLYAWGDNSFGSFGNGDETDWQHYSTPYSGDPALKFGKMYTHPTKITNKGNWKSVYGGTLFGFTTFAIDVLGNRYFAGRNKGGVAGNGVVECTGANGDQSANYANSWDVPWLTPINPQAISSSIPTVCPGCVNGAVTAFCSECTNPTTTVNASAPNQNLSSGTTSTILTAAASTSSGGKITYILWTPISGPTAPIIDVNAATQINVSNLINGTYVIQLKITDNSWRTSTVNVNIVISGGVVNQLYITRKKAHKLKIF